VERPAERTVALALTGLATLGAFPVAGFFAFFATAAARELPLLLVLVVVALVTLGVPVGLGGLVFCRRGRWRAAIVTAVLSFLITGLAASVLGAVAFGLSGA
jgi:hypothetical protein